MIDNNTFKTVIIKAHNKRNHKLKKSFGMKQAWRWIKKHKWLSIQKPISERMFGTIIRKVNTALGDKIISGGNVSLPQGMGKIYLQKTKAFIDFKNNKLRTNLPIDWDRTIKYWEEDATAFKNKNLLRVENKYIYKIRYNKGKVRYKNVVYYSFFPNRNLKNKLRDRIRDNNTDAYLMDYGIH